MDINDIRNSRLPNRIEKSIFNDISKSARYRPSLNAPNFVENRRTKTSLSEKDLIFHDPREESFNFLCQKQFAVKKSNCKTDKPVVPTVVVRRKPEDKLKNPDRLSLDRQNLTSCPILENEENVRLLNYQYNYINQIQHLEKLRKLILLDLYDNRIEKISGLDTLKSLRVLMLGRNRIGKIEGLDSLVRLDVLDLHANSLQVIENINHLSDLRVLNLAGNNITCLTNLKGLYSLSEINVRRNCIESVIDVNTNNCPNLQRIFLSYNHLAKITDFSCLVDLVSLNEMSLDNNPICSHNSFRSAVIFNFSQLEQLDSKQISDDDRNRAKQIINRVELGSKSNSGLSRHVNMNNNRSPNNEMPPNNIQRFHSLKERRKGNVFNSQRMLETWNQSGRNVSPRLSIKCFSSTSSSLYVTDSPNNSSTGNDAEQDIMSRSLRLNKSSQDFNSSLSKEFMAIEETIVKPAQYQRLGSPQTPSKKVVLTRPSSSSSLLKHDVSKPPAVPVANHTEIHEQISTNDNIVSSGAKASNKNNIEIVSESEQIQFYSRSALKIFDDKEFWISKAGLSSTVTTLVFQQIDFDDIEKFFFHIKARFPSLKKIVFQSSNIKCYTQINSMATLKRLEELIIEKSENPIMSFSLVRYYVIFRLAHLGLKKFDDIEITDQEYNTARRYFYSLATVGPSHILQLHLVGLLTDIRKRELQHSLNNDQLVPMSIHNSSFSQTPSVNLDLVGKSGLLCSFSSSDSDDVPENLLKNLSSAVVDNMIDCVEKQCSWEDRFHSQWLSSIWQLILNRLTPVLINRHEYMKNQFDRIVSKTAVVKPNLTNNRK